MQNFKWFLTSKQTSKSFWYRTMTMLCKFSHVERLDKYNSKYPTHIIWQCIQYLWNMYLAWELLMKVQKYCSACKHNHCRLGSLCICLHTYLYLHSIAWVFLSPSGPTTRQLAVRFYSKWSCATSGVIVLARRLGLGSNRYIVHESANIVMISMSKSSNDK